MQEPLLLHPWNEASAGKQTCTVASFQPTLAGSPMSLISWRDGLTCGNSPHKGGSHRLQSWNPTSGISGNWEEMGRTRICPQTKQDRGFPLLRNLCVPETCRTKTCTWLFWQEKEGLDYPFPAHESGHLRRKCRRHICFSTNRAPVKASPWSSLLRHSLADGEAAAVGCTQGPGLWISLSSWCLQGDNGH